MTTSPVKNGNGFGFILGTFAVGAAVGATIALLTTPRSGRELLARLKNTSRGMGEMVQQIPGAVQKGGAKVKEEATLAYNRGADRRPGSKKHKGNTHGKELSHFAR